MSNYSKLTDFASKDALPSGSATKIVKGTEIDDEFQAIESAIATKANLDSPTFTGAPRAPTVAANTFSTHIATAAMVQAAIGQDDIIDEDGLKNLGTGTEGQVLTSDGATGFAWVNTSTISSPPTMQVFTASGTWTKPTGCKAIKVTVTGAGGGGGSTTISQKAGSGGGAGATAVKIINVTDISDEIVTVGIGGSAETAGGDSSFGEHCSATGGAGGTGRLNSTVTSGGTAGGIATGGDINIPGGTGGGHIIDGIIGYGGSGGSSIYGGTGAIMGGSSYKDGTTATVYGAGGSGAAGDSGAATGGAGADGIVIVEEFY